MINGKKVIGLIPARSGSKRLPGKNSREFCGKPLLQWTCECALASRYIDRLILSTDDTEIRDIGLACGIDAPFLRPAEFSNDTAGSYEVIMHALGALEEKFDIIVWLQPTSPLRTTQDIDSTIKCCAEQNTGSSFTVTEACKNPHKMYWLDAQQQISPIIAIPESFRDQDLPTAYSSNGAVYVAFTDWLKESGSFVKQDTKVHVMPRERSVDIDDIVDWISAEALMQRQLQTES